MTGASLVVGGYALDQWTVVAIGVGLVVAGAVAVRATFRRGKAVEDI